MIREIKFYARDILRGPMAKTPLGFHGSYILLALILASPLFFLLH